jgi:hypothetical protein
MRSISPPIINPGHGPSIYAPTAIGRPVRVISVTVERGILTNDNMTPTAANIALSVIVLVFIRFFFISRPSFISS